MAILQGCTITSCNMYVYKHHMCYLKPAHDWKLCYGVPYNICRHGLVHLLRQTKVEKETALNGYAPALPDNPTDEDIDEMLTYSWEQVDAGRASEMGIDTGVDVDRVLNIGRMLEKIIGRRLRSECVHTGRIPKGLTGRI